MKNSLYYFIFIAFVLACNSKDISNNKKNTTSIQKQNVYDYDSAIGAKLMSSYYKYIDSVSKDTIYFKTGKKLGLKNSIVKQNYEDSLNNASIADMFLQKYSCGINYQLPIPINFDPGRIRNDEFFKEIYGKSKDQVQNNLTTVIWLPKNCGVKIKFSKLNGAATQLQKVSNELDKLPKKYIEYLYPIGGTFNWRVIAGTTRLSMHSFGIAIDINTKNSHYWRNFKNNKNGLLKYHNNIPLEIVQIFEKYGFIWGGKWYHFDTMHFEYRPELL